MDAASFFLIGGLREPLDYGFVIPRTPTLPFGARGYC